MMSAYMMAFTTVHDEAVYREYVKAVGPLMEQYGVKFLNDGRKFDVLEGGLNPTRAYVFEFPSMALLREFYDSEEYQACVKIRKPATDVTIVVTESLEDD